MALVMPNDVECASRTSSGASSCGSSVRSSSSSIHAADSPPLSACSTPRDKRSCRPCDSSVVRLDSPTRAIPALPPQTPQPQSPPLSSFDFSSQFVELRRLSRTIYGEMKLVAPVDAPHRRMVVKASSLARMQQKQLGPCRVHEDVRKEARVMRALGVAEPQLYTPLQHHHIDLRTCGLSEGFLRAHADPSNPSRLSDAALRAIASGRRFLSPLLGEWDDGRTHYLATGFAPGGDLFDYLSRKAAPQRIDESQARVWFRQLCASVLYMHALSTAHLDISIENVCIDARGDLQIIDLGLAARHPQCSAQRFSSDEIVNSVPLASSHADVATGGAERCTCGACLSDPSKLSQRVDDQISHTMRHYPRFVSAAVCAAPKPAPRAPELPPPDVERMADVEEDECGHMIDRIKCSAEGCDLEAQWEVVSPPSPPRAEDVLASSCRFLLRPICSQTSKPGKLGYTAPELHDSRAAHAPWDAYKQDTFSLGVLLFVLLTGHPPFSCANAESDVWFRWLASGEWLLPKRYSLPVAQHYTHLSPNAWLLLDWCFKPQHVRPSIDQIMQHPWFDEAHPLSRPVKRTTMA